jgi:transposase
MYREVTMMELREVIQLWREQMPKKRIAARLGLDPKTVRRYVSAAEAAGLREQGTLSDEQLRDVLLALQPGGGRPHGESWARCGEQREAIQRWLASGLRLTKIRKLLARQGVLICYPTLYRFAVEQLQFGRTAPTMPVRDGEPGQELQVDTGWVGWLTLALLSRRRRFRAWIFTAVFSRYRFVYPIFEETTVRAIEACEAAWQFFGGIFHVLIPDNTKAIIAQPDALTPHIVPAFLEYAQARNFHVDAARVRHPRDKARVERAVPNVRDDCFAGELLATLDAARVHALHWCREEYGLRPHSRTQRPPRQFFEAEEQSALLPAPTAPYDIPLWSTPRVARDQLAQVAKAFYSIPHAYISQLLSARADQQTVRFYHRGAFIKMHPRKPPGGRSIDAQDYPVERSIYALRDVQALQRQAAIHGEAVGRFAAALLDNPLPWTRMRHVYALLGLARRYGASRVNDACATALTAEMFDVRRLQRMLEQATVSSATAASPHLTSRFLRPASQYALPLASGERTSQKGDDPNDHRSDQSRSKDRIKTAQALADPKQPA